MHGQEGQLSNRSFSLLLASSCCLRRPRLGGVAPNRIQLACQWPRLVETGSALDLCPRSAAFLPLLFRQLLAIGFRGGSKSRSRAELPRRARVPGFDIAAPALFAVPHVVNVLPPLSTLRNIRWRHIIHWLASVIATACRRFGSGPVPPTGLILPPISSNFAFGNFTFLSPRCTSIQS